MWAYMIQDAGRYVYEIMPVRFIFMWPWCRCLTCIVHSFTASLLHGNRFPSGFLSADCIMATFNSSIVCFPDMLQSYFRVSVEQAACFWGICSFMWTLKRSSWMAPLVSSPCCVVANCPFTRTSWSQLRHNSSQDLNKVNKIEMILLTYLHSHLFPHRTY